MANFFRAREVRARRTRLRRGEARILGIAGSLRRDSFNRAALRAAQELAPASTRVEVFELDGIPVFNQDHERSPPSRVAELKQRVREADAVLLVTPEYNHSVPGVLKNAIDWASRPQGDNAWDDKLVAIMGASAGADGTHRAHEHLRQAFAFLNMRPVDEPEVVIANATDRFRNGRLVDEASRERVGELLARLAAKIPRG